MAYRIELPEGLPEQADDGIRTGLPGQESLNRTSSTELPVQDLQDRTPMQDCQDRTANYPPS